MTNVRTRIHSFVTAPSTFVAAGAILSVSCMVTPVDSRETEGRMVQDTLAFSRRSRSDLQPSDRRPDARARIASRLGLPHRFLVGLGNDVGEAEDWDPARAHAFGLGPKLDIHYLYLSGLDWPSWTSPEGAYVSIHAWAAKARGVIPMFTLYQAAAWGERNLAAFADESFMKAYWSGVRAMYERLGDVDSPAIVHLEPDLWGYFQQECDSPSGVQIKVGSLVPECAGMPEDVSGFGRCLVELARLLAPKAVVGLSASVFAAHTASGASDPQRIASYLNEVGSVEADLLVVETLDRDAGCFEAAFDELCKRDPATQWGGSFYWSDAAFRSHLAWAKTIHEGTGKALLWWQMPLGVPSGTPGGSSGRYRDNRVSWLFRHPNEFAEAGGIGAVFGTGAPNQTSARTDGGQFKDAVTKYLEAGAWF